MKKFSKAIIAFAAVASLSAAMAVCASADMAATYDAEAGTVAITGFTAQEQTTMVVLSGDDANIVADNIKAIDQQAQADAETAYGAVKVGTLADGTYTVKVGGTNGTIEVATFTVGGGDTPTYTKGDANEDGKVNGKDASTIVRYVLGTEDLSEAQLLAADVNDDNKVNGKDASHIVRYVLGTDEIN